jgi:hypothetical protein
MLSVAVVQGLLVSVTVRIAARVLVQLKQWRYPPICGSGNCSNNNNAISSLCLTMSANDYLVIRCACLLLAFYFYCNCHYHQSLDVVTVQVTYSYTCCCCHCHGHTPVDPALSMSLSLPPINPSTHEYCEYVLLFLLFDFFRKLYVCLFLFRDVY